MCRGFCSLLLLVMHSVTPTPDTTFVFLLLDQESACCSSRRPGYSFSLLISSAVSMEEKVSWPSIQIILIAVTYRTLNYETITMPDSLCALCHLLLKIILQDKNHNYCSTNGKLEAERFSNLSNNPQVVNAERFKSGSKCPHPNSDPFLLSLVLSYTTV